MKKNYSLSAIMNCAWAIRKAAAEKMNCKPSAVLMSECLKLAWAKAEGQYASVNASAVAAQWSNMPDAEKVRMMSKCIRKAAKNDIGYSIEDRYLQFDEIPAFGCYAPHAFDEFVNETCIRVLQNLQSLGKLTAKNERRAAQGKRPLTLVSIVYNAARASIAAIYYADSKHSAASDPQVRDDDGETASGIETIVADKRQNTERAAVIRAELKDYSAKCDAIGKQIVQLVMEGMTEREIGKAVGISNVAVHKRIVKMREALQNIRFA